MHGRALRGEWAPPSPFVPSAPGLSSVPMTNASLRPTMARFCALGLAFAVAAGPLRAETAETAPAVAPGPDPDGHWRASLALGVSLSSGNSRSSSLSLNGEASRVSDDDRLFLGAKALSAHSDGNTTGELWKLSARGETRLGERGFGTASLEAEHDAVAQISLRVVPSLGLGWRLVDGEDHKFNVSLGVAYPYEDYSEPRQVGDDQRLHDQYFTPILSEDSQHRFGTGVTLRQRLVLTPNPHRDGELRADFDSALQVALSARLALNIGLTLRYDTAPAPGLRRTDTLLITGLALKFE